MEALVEVILPIFLVLGFGYVVRWRGGITDDQVTGLMRFAQGFGLPCLLFRAISTLNLGQSFDIRLLFSFYTGALTSFVIALLAAHFLFRRAWEDSVAIGFAALFSNGLLLGLPITQRAYGDQALTGNFTVLAFHSPFCYGVGITVMEVVRHRGRGFWKTARQVLRSMFSNSLVLGITLGFIVNLTHLPVPRVAGEALDMLAKSAVPVALFGLGGVLYRYRPEGDFRIIAMVCACSLLLHPAITYTLSRSLGVSVPYLRSGVVMAAMAPGVNSYLFADMYGVGRRVAASSLLLATAATVLTAWFWLSVLP